MPAQFTRPGRGRRTGLWLPSLFLVFGLLTTLAIVIQTERVIKQEQQTQWDAEASRVRNELRLHIYRHIDALRTYQAEFFAHPHFSEGAFHRVADVLKIRERLPGIDAIGYARRLQFSAPKHSFVLQVVYLHGRSSETPSLARHIDMDSLRLEAVHRARDLGDMAATAPTSPLVDPSRPDVILVFLPLYYGGVVPETLEERRRNFEGVVFVSLQADRLLHSLFSSTGSEHTHVRMAFDGYIEANAAGAANNEPFEHKESLVESGPERAHLPFTLAGTRWTLDMEMPVHEARSQRWLPWVVLAAGLFLSMLSAAIISMLQRARWVSQERAEEDRSLRREAEAALHLRERAIEASANAIVIASATKKGYPVEYVNPAFERMTGYKAHEILGQSLRVMHGPDTYQEGLAELQRILEEKTEGQATLRNYRKDGELYWTRVHIAPVRDDHGTVTHFVAAKYDTTQTRRYQETLEFQAWHDALTLLPNRHALRARLTQAIDDYANGGPAFWVAFLDLDNFKLMNDSVGHTHGDQAIQQIAQRVKEALHETDMVARRGGDEFVFILFDAAAPRNALATLHRIMSAVSRPLVLDTQRFHPTCSVGVAMHPQDGDDPELLIKHADMAMYSAKRLGRNNYQFFSTALLEQALERVRLEADLRAALEKEEFELHYQPQIRLHDEHLNGVEALVRWRHPERGLVPPAQFIPVAEETGLIIPLGEWILRAACRQAAEWQAAGLPPIRMAVNLSARQFHTRELPEMVQSALRDAKLDPGCLELELTETLLAEDVEAANRVLQVLKGIGVTLSLDDFGTGYSSMAQLKRFPLDILKIDRSFVMDIGSDESGGMIVRTIIKLAHSLGLIALAEGVETEEQKAFLKLHGCDTIQGYFLSRPLPPDEFFKWVHERAQLPSGGEIPSSPVS